MRSGGPSPTGWRHTDSGERAGFRGLRTRAQGARRPGRRRHSRGHPPRAVRGGPAGGGDGSSKPVSLWWYVMVAALGLAIAESLLGNRHLGVDKEAA